MTAPNLVERSYKNSQRELASDKSIELKVFSQITSRLRAADISKPGGMSKLAEALQENMKLWNILLTDVSLETNTLPLELKAQIISLAIFSQKHTLAVLGGRATPDVLIDINKAMIAGMRNGLETSSSSTEAA